MNLKVLPILLALTLALPSLVYSYDKNPSQILLIDSLMNVAYELEFSNPDSAISLYNEIARLAETESDWLRKGQTQNYTAIVYFEKGDYESALLHYHRALELFEKANNLTGVATIKINIGNIRLYFGDYNDAVKLYFEGIDLYKQEKDSLRLMISYMNIGTLFYQNQYLSEALNYYHQAIEWARSMGEKTFLSDLHYNIGNTYFQLEQFQDYKAHLDTSLVYAQATEYTFGLVNCHISLLRYYHQQNHKANALRYSDLAIQYAEAYGNPYNLVETYNAAGITYLTFGETLRAEKYLMISLELAEKHNYRQLLAEAKIYLAQYYSDISDYRQAYALLKAYTTLADSLFNMEKQKELQELDRKYQIVKKENELKDQQLTIELKDREIFRKNRIITSSSLFIVFISLSLFMMYKMQENRKKLTTKELQRIKSEREKEVIKAMLEGEEKERSRIARELHDGINGNLAALKLNMTSLRNDLFNRLIDETMEDVRNLSHNLMPEVVVKFGLMEALNQYISQAGFGKDVKLDYQFVGNPETISHDIAVNTYRIVQELVSNSIKHADASEINVQLIVNDGILSIAVEDNGKGFEINMTGKHPPNAGIGLSNVKNRITFMQGNYDIHSSTDSTTSINIEIPLKRIAS